MKIRGKYTRNNELKFISHLNTIDLLQRAIFYTDVEVLFSEGFNAHPKMSFGNPLPLGVSSDHEIFDVEVADGTDIKYLMNKANEYLPNDVKIFEMVEEKENISISKIYKYSIYEFTIYTDLDLEKIDINLDDNIIIQRKKKSKNKKYFEYIEENITNNVFLLEGFKRINNESFSLVCKLENSSEKIINPLRFIEGLFKKYDLDISVFDVSIHKKEMI